MSEEDRPLQPVVVKKYANRRLYDTESSIYITLDTLADMVRRGRDFVVYDAKTGDDITRAVLTQIIMEEETKGRNMLPTSFLRQLIGLYGDSLQGLVPAYLERMMQQFSAEQQAASEAVVQPLAQPARPALPSRDEAVQPGIAVLERTTNLYKPFHRPGPDTAAVSQTATAETAAAVELDPAEALAENLLLRQEVARLRRELAEASAALPEQPIRSLVRGGARH
ncbi:polyhydroxyalkanoate synthesis repressor PhaR [Lichenicoccus roseus]|uniref:Polyhydroxyalkanoate synthesis repressor PhaR n=1 Tax=Lichenicoccus roseus TaxID=2683649 RepID=A0A5R9J8Y5_9PROT|nr:polyhydroxyalkanoate synthesis repressor PhaR [Lichenicoccus roseus]TLU73449.1 polyhydroxyalkanoate synthesis repressor PhaR [Lichenicoccus roseus]